MWTADIIDDPCRNRELTIELVWEDETVGEYETVGRFFRSDESDLVLETCEHPTPRRPVPLVWPRELVTRAEEELPFIRHPIEDYNVDERPRTSYPRTQTWSRDGHRFYRAGSLAAEIAVVDGEDVFRIVDITEVFPLDLLKLAG